LSARLEKKTGALAGPVAKKGESTPEKEEK